MQLLQFKDARYFQIVFQSLFLFYGIFYLHWNNDLGSFAIYISTCLLTQLCWELLLNHYSLSSTPFLKYGSWKSALITAFGLCLLLKTTHWYFGVLAAFIAISGKYLLVWNKKHLVNPSALGITAMILLTGQGWISPGQWGSSVILFFMVTSLGFIVVTKVQKADVTLTFLGTYFLLLFCRQVLYLGWPLDFFIQSVTTGSLLLFSFFMISDPKTTPNHPTARILYAILIAAVSFYLSAFKFINASPLWVLVIASPMVPLFDWLFLAERFTWNSTHHSHSFNHKIITS